MDGATQLPCATGPVGEILGGGQNGFSVGVAGHAAVSAKGVGLAFVDTSQGHRIGGQLGSSGNVTLFLLEALHPDCYQSERRRALYRNHQTATKEATVLEVGAGLGLEHGIHPFTHQCFGVLGYHGGLGGRGKEW